MDSQSNSFRVEKMGESSGNCDCCGNESRCVWGMVYKDNVASAAYWMQWAVGCLTETGANLDLVVGRWGNNTSAADRVAIALVHRQQPDGAPALMVVDAAGRPIARKGVASSALAREDVIGAPLAAQVFSLTEAIYEQDDRFF
jgi:hypothetical protein